MGNIPNNIKCNCFDKNQEDETELNAFENNNKKKINKKTILKKAQENKEKID
jgi:hypothetical protein